MSDKKSVNIIISIFILVTTVGIVYSRYTNMIDNSDVISFIGAIIGALIGVIGALYVVYKDRKSEKYKSVEKLIQMFKHTYIWIYSRHYIGAGYSVESLSEPIVPLIYDEKWKEYIIEIEDTHHKRFLLAWFYTLESLENKKEFVGIVSEDQLKEAKNILKYYNMYDKEVQDIESKMNSETILNFKKYILDLQNEHSNIIDELYEEQEAWCDKYESELEDEDLTYEDEIYNNIKTAIREYDRNIVINSIYKF